MRVVLLRAEWPFLVLHRLALAGNASLVDLMTEPLGHANPFA